MFWNTLAIDRALSIESPEAVPTYSRITAKSNWEAPIVWIREYVGTASGDSIHNALSMANVFQNITTASAAITTINNAIQSLATLRATNGSEQVRLTFASDMLAINKVNLESANSRIADVDIASESANLARFNILQQAGTAMLAQANMSQQSVLRLLS